TARFGEVASGDAAVLVRPVLETRLVGSRAVGRPLRLAARLRPAGAGRLTVRIWRGGRRTHAATHGSSVRLGLRTRRAASYRIRVIVEPTAGYTGASRTLAVTVVQPRLSLGSRGPSVRALEARLAELRYALPAVDGAYGLDTYQAVLAFQKVHGLPWTGRADASLWNALARARPPRARYGGDHLEVSKGRQVLLAVRSGRVTAAVHVSTGATGNTPIGRWQVYRKVAGWDWVLWYPMYFLRGFAIHGYPSVPAYPASHGCVRVPMWIAPSLYSANPYGQTVYVYW
ncbi:MAG: L,D-transpeptidase family protein, partial [Gaiellaceae bacterium]